MDPEATLLEARDALQRGDRDLALDEYLALDDWLSRGGGFLPPQWAVKL